MNDSSTKKPLHVSDHGAGGPYFWVPVSQLAEVCRLLDANRVPSQVDEYTISLATSRRSPSLTSAPAATARPCKKSWTASPNRVRRGAEAGPAGAVSPRELAAHPQSRRGCGGRGRRESVEREPVGESGLLKAVGRPRAGSRSHPKGERTHEGREGRRPEAVPQVGTDEWSQMNRRRADLIRKKLGGELTESEREESETSQRLSLAAVDALFPLPGKPRPRRRTGLRGPAGDERPRPVRLPADSARPQTRPGGIQKLREV